MKKFPCDKTICAENPNPNISYLQTCERTRVTRTRERKESERGRENKIKINQKRNEMTIRLDKVFLKTMKDEIC